MEKDKVLQENAHKMKKTDFHEKLKQRSLKETFKVSFPQKKNFAQFTNFAV